MVQIKFVMAAQVLRNKISLITGIFLSD